MSKPKFVAISDLHFRVSTLELASSALRSAIVKALHLQIPLIIAGDLIDSKSIIPAEVANRLVKIFENCPVETFILVGNHDLINEKGTTNSLNFLAPYANIVSHPSSIDNDLWLIPYHSSKDDLQQLLKTIPSGSTLVMHQGFLGAMMGEYIQDKSSISVEAVKDFRVITGHYHKHQIIGTVTYIGSPYTITFAEANDGPKGYLIVNEDGSFTREILQLRKHIVLDQHFDAIYHDSLSIGPEDLVWLKLRGPLSELQKIDKGKLPFKNLRLDLIPDSIENSNKINSVTKEMSVVELFDTIIDNSGDTKEQNEFLKRMYRELIES